MRALVNRCSLLRGYYGWDTAVDMPTSISIFERRRRNLLLLLESRYRGSQADLARAIRRSPSYVWRLLLEPERANAKRLGEDLARIIERSSNLPRYWLDQEHGQAQNVLHDAQSAGASDVALPPPRSLGPKAIPILDLDSLDVSTQQPRGSAVGFVYTDSHLGPATFAVIARGDAMEPAIAAGDKVFIDPDTYPRPGDVVLAKAGTTVVLRQYRPTDETSGHFELAALNSAYAAIASDRTDCKVVGVMVEHHRYRRPR